MTQFNFVVIVRDVNNILNDDAHSIVSMSFEETLTLSHRAKQSKNLSRGERMKFRIQMTESRDAAHQIFARMEFANETINMHIRTYMGGGVVYLIF